MNLCCQAAVPQPRNNLSYGADEAKIPIILEPRVSQFNRLHRCPTQTSRKRGIVHTNSTTRHCFNVRRRSERKQRDWGPLCRPRHVKSSEEAAVPGRAGLTSPWRNVNLGWRSTRRAERGFGWPQSFGHDESSSDHKGLTGKIKKTPGYELLLFRDGGRVSQQQCLHIVKWTHT